MTVTLLSDLPLLSFPPQGPFALRFCFTPKSDAQVGAVQLELTQSSSQGAAEYKEGSDGFMWPHPAEV